jgi:hypothetical protein
MGFFIALGLNCPNAASLVFEDKVSPKVLLLPLVRVFIPQPSLSNRLRPCWVVLKKPLTENLKVLPVVFLASDVGEKLIE